MCYSIAETGNTLDNFAQGGADIEYMDAPVFTPIKLQLYSTFPFELLRHHYLVHYY